MVAKIAAGGTSGMWRGISGDAVLGSCGKGSQETTMWDGEGVPGGMSDCHDRGRWHL